MKTRVTTVLMAAAMSMVPLAMAPGAHADICAGAHGRHFAAGGCTPGLAGDAIAGAVVASTVPYGMGEVPCYTAEGVPYYTPDGDPC